MTRILTLGLAAAAMGLAFVAPDAAWLVLMIGSCLLLLGLSTERVRPRGEIAEDLSHDARKLLDRYAFFYRAPRDAVDFSIAARVLTFTAVGVGFVGLFHAFWWGFVLTPLHVVLMWNAAAEFEPTHVLNTDLAERAHFEASAYAMRRASGLICGSGSAKLAATDA